MKVWPAGVVLVLALAHCGNSDTVQPAGVSAAMPTRGVDAGSAPARTPGVDSGTEGNGSTPDGALPAATPDAAAAAIPDAAVDAAPSSTPTCGARSGMRGLTSRTLMVAGLQRTYLIYLPTTADSDTPMPFVFVFHGYTMSGQQMHDITQYATLAESEGFGVAFPDGEGGADSLEDPWNVENANQTVCGYGQYASATGDDFAFIDAMKADVSQDQCLDAAHVFSVGFSMGAYFTEHIGCYRSDMRGLAPHSGGTLADLSPCTTGHVPIILFHGTSDSVIDDACDDPTVPPDVGFPPAATLWAQKNGCATTYTTVSNEGAGGGAGQCYLYDGCPADGQVELCTFTGMDHCWAGGSTAGTGADSACPTYASATQLQWSFFTKYAW
jgi:polyhydroxybutyrate depolymerase